MASRTTTREGPIPPSRSRTLAPSIGDALTLGRRRAAQRHLSDKGRPMDGTASPDDPEGRRSRYDPDRFYTAASDLDGNKVNLEREVEPEILAEIRKVVGTDPAFDTVDDVVRNAVVHHLGTRVEQLNDPALARDMEEIFAAFDAQEERDRARWSAFEAGME